MKPGLTMAHIIQVNQISPNIPPCIFLAVNATVIGNVSFGENCSVWFNTVVRADVNNIVIGNNVNIQDGAIIHCTYQEAATTIGNNVSIGHNAIVHGCTIKDNVLVGMGSIVMDQAIIGEGSIIAAGAVVLEKTIVPPNTIYAGVPAKKVKSLDPEEAKAITQKTADNYIKYKSWYEES